ncbi:MAG TPA: DUF1570 domain-containing protein [Opitutaceae bacterium]|nr:DUF1570 domain-containing protein [Opitutaceae bacterium]
MRVLRQLASMVGIGLSLLPGALARERWIWARTDHFEMFSSASEEESRDLLVNLEQFRATVLSIYSLPRLRDPRTTVVVFGTDRQFDPFKPLYNGTPTDVAGYCIGSSDETVIALTTGHGFTAAGEIIFHEYVHLLLSAGGEQPPLWLNEGLAELFSTFRIRKGSVELGRAKPDHVDTLNHLHLMPLSWLFAVTTESSSYNEGVRQSIFYAESWALVHYLVCGEDCATDLPKLRRFKDLLALPDSVVDRSFREAFGMSYGDMEANLRRYLQSGQYFIHRDKLPVGDLSAQVKFRTADDFEQEVALVNLRWRVRQDASTAYRLLQLAQSRPGAPRPHEVLAAVAMREGDPEGAFVHWRRAADLGSENAYIYLQLAKEKLDEITSGLSLDYRMPAELTGQLRSWLDRAVGLSPNYLEAYEALADVEALAESPRLDVMNRVQGNLPRMKDKMRTLFAIAIVRWRTQDFVTARQIAVFLMAMPQVSADLRGRAESLYARIPPPAESPATPAPAGSAEAPSPR